MAPTHPVPALQRNPVCPPRLLAHRHVDAIGEESSRGDQFSVLAPDPEEPRRTAILADAQSQLVILGQRLVRERSVPALLLRQPGQRIARKGAAHARRRNAAGKRIANHHRLAMALGELVRIMAADPAGMALRQGQHGKLDEGVILDSPVEQADGGRINDIFRVVEHHHPVGLPATPLVQFDRAIETIETIGLGRRTVALKNDEPQPRIAARPSDCRFQRRRIVAIDPDIDSQIALFP